MIAPAAPQPRRAAAPIGSGEFAFDQADFKQIAAMLHADSGIFLAEEKASLVYGRLIKRLRTLGLHSFKEYCRLVGGEGGIDERQRMLAALTTNVTSFFREKHHFDYLKSTVLPPLLRQAKAGGRVRIWSAGCSKGHEPFSIAATVLGCLPEAGDLDVKILATDIDPFVVAHGREGIYSREDVADLPTEAKRYFRPAGGSGDVAVTDALTRLVSFRELNLIGTWPMKGKFDIIFCRNVTIYFNTDTQAMIWDRYAANLKPEGHLFIGHSERLSDAAQKRFVTVGTTMYRLKGSAAA
jgi:chemotaxis protein methyltransferase CheR